MIVVVHGEGRSYTESSISRYTKALHWGPKRLECCGLLLVLDGRHINESVVDIETGREGGFVGEFISSLIGSDSSLHRYQRVGGMSSLARRRARGSGLASSLSGSAVEIRERGTFVPFRVNKSRPPIVC